MFVFSELRPLSDLFIVHQRSSFSFLPLHQLPITTPQRLGVCFWGFLNIFMWGAGIACGGGVDGWSTTSDGDSSEISERLEVKVKRSKKKPSELCGSPSLYDDLRASRFLPGLLKYCVCHDELLAYRRHTILNLYTLNTHIHITAVSCVNPHRWTPAVHLYVFQSFVIVIQTENSRTKTDNATVRLN